MGRQLNDLVLILLFLSGILVYQFLMPIFYGFLAAQIYFNIVNYQLNSFKLSIALRKFLMT
jgi:hypothetical protein